MCGRYAFFAPRALIERAFGLTYAPEVEPRYNIAPTQFVPIVRVESDGHRALRMVRWGLVPWWAREESVGNRMINARAESLSRNAAFRDAFEARRCLVPASGFYEWAREGRVRIPHYLARNDGEPFAFAGLWSRWRPREPDAPPLESCTIITTNANALVASIHDRMPVILPAESYAEWLDPLRRSDAVAHWLRPADATGYTERIVSRAVNDARREGAELIEPASAGLPRDLFGDRD
jgi:putative SOS response-associated peptidase YedK